MSFSFNVSSAKNGLLFVTCGQGAGAVRFGTVVAKWNTTNMTLIGADQNDPGSKYYSWYTLSPTTGNLTLSVDISTEFNAVPMAVGVAAFEGISKVLSTGTGVNGSSVGTTSNTSAASVSSALAIGGILVSQGGTVTTGSSETVLHSIALTEGTLWFGYETPGTTAVNFTPTKGTGQDWSGRTVVFSELFASVPTIWMQ